MRCPEFTEEHEKKIEMPLATPLTAVASYSGDAMVRKDDEKNRRKALLKIDFCIMPFLCLSVMLQCKLKCHWMSLGMLINPFIASSRQIFFRVRKDNGNEHWRKYQRNRLRLVWVYLWVIEDYIRLLLNSISLFWLPFLSTFRNLSPAPFSC